MTSVPKVVNYFDNKYWKQLLFQNIRGKLTICLSRVCEIVTQDKSTPQAWASGTQPASSELQRNTGVHMSLWLISAYLESQRE